MKSQRVTSTLGSTLGPQLRRSLVLAIATVLIAGATGRSVVRAASDDKPESLIYAVYSGEKTAGDVFKTMAKSQRSTGERIEAYAVVSKDLKGNVHVRDQRKTDAGIGAVVGGVIGLLGGPITAALAAGAGGAAGYLTGNAVGISQENVDAIRSSLTPDSSALVVVLEDRWMEDVEKDMNKAQARSVIASKIASGSTSTTK